MRSHQTSESTQLLHKAIILPSYVHLQHTFFHFIMIKKLGKPSILKLFEKLILKQLVDLPEHQFKLQNQHWLIKFTVNIVTEKAHQELLFNCGYWHFSGIQSWLACSLNLFTLTKLLSISWLCDLSVSSAKKENRFCQISASIPQGSVLGSILYLLYTADLPDNNITVPSFVDATVVICQWQPDTSCWKFADCT